MKIYHRKGNVLDYLESDTPYSLAHNCNCFHTMGSGVAKALNAHTNGVVLSEDKTTPYGDINKLGTYSVAKYGIHRIFNLYGMFTYATLHKRNNPNNVYVHWELLTKSLTDAIIDSDNDFIIPVLGCNHAGGNVDDFINMIEVVSNNVTVDTSLTIVYQ